MSELTSPIGLVAGNGIYPLEFVRAARSRGLSVVALAYSGETDPAIEAEVSACTWIKVGQLGKLISVLKKARVKQVAFAGGIRRVKLFGNVKPDWRGLNLIARLRSFKDDVLLRGVAEELEKEGVTVISASLLLTDSIARAGTLTRRSFSEEEQICGRLAWEVASEIGRLDVGQGAVSYDRTIIALEAIEGTDEMIIRAGNLAGTAGKKVSTAGPVLVKVSKPGQDQRLDLPSVGVKTIEVMQAAGLSALVLEAGKCLILDPVSVVTRADSLGIAIKVVEQQSDI